LLLGDQVDDAAGSGAAVKYRGRAFQDFNAIDIRHIRGNDAVKHKVVTIVVTKDSEWKPSDRDSVADIAGQEHVSIDAADILGCVSEVRGLLTLDQSLIDDAYALWDFIQGNVHFRSSC